MAMSKEKGIPLPLPSKQKYPFSELEVGESFFVETEDYRKVCSVQALASMHSKRMGKRFTTQSRKKDGGVRVWRVE